MSNMKYQALLNTVKDYNHMLEVNSKEIANLTHESLRLLIDLEKRISELVPSQDQNPNNQISLNNAYAQYQSFSDKLAEITCRTDDTLSDAGLSTTDYLEQIEDAAYLIEAAKQTEIAEDVCEQFNTFVRNNQDIINQLDQLYVAILNFCVVFHQQTSPTTCSETQPPLLHAFPQRGKLRKVGDQTRTAADEFPWALDIPGEGESFNVEPPLKKMKTG